jgi:hypothetical protein
LAIDLADEGLHTFGHALAHLQSHIWNHIDYFFLSLHRFVINFNHV